MTTRSFSGSPFDNRVDTIGDWIERIDRNRANPPAWVLESRLDEYRLTMLVASLVLLDAKFAHDGRHGDEMRPRHLADAVWQRLEQLMRDGASCAFPRVGEVLCVAPASEDAAESDAVSGTRLRSERDTMLPETGKRNAG